MVDIATETGVKFKEPAAGDRDGWAKLMKKVGVKGVHIAERDTQRTRTPKPFGTFWNTWSVEGFISEGLQPAELGWGTHETWIPKNAKKHKKGSKAAIYLDQPGANTRVRTWCPTLGPQYGFLVTHNESISIADFFTVRDKDGKATYRPTAHYAYHPANDAVLSLHECSAMAARRRRSSTCSTRTNWSTAPTNSACFSTGHKKNAYWYGSQLTLEEARKLAPYPNATGLQVSSRSSPAWSGRSRTRKPASSRPTRSTIAAASRCRSPILDRSRATTPTDAAHDAAVALPGGYRPEGPLAVPQHPRPISTDRPRRSLICGGFRAMQTAEMRWKKENRDVHDEVCARSGRRAGRARPCQAPAPMRSQVTAAPASPVEGEWEFGRRPSRCPASRAAPSMTRATDTGNVLANGSYRFVDSRTVSISVTSLIRNTTSNVNCALATQSQLNCTTRPASSSC